MVSLLSLWLPILVSAILIFIASSLVHMVLPWHRNDFRHLENEDALRSAFRSLNIPPGDYLVPCANSPKDLKDPAFIAKVEEGPNLVMTVMPARGMNIGKNLVGWFVYSIVVSVFAAYITSRAVPAGAPYLDVFRFAGCIAYMGYGLALWQQPIWWSKSWATTFRANVDALIYGLLTAGAFGWLWPK